MRDFLLQQNDYRSLRKETLVAMMRLIVYHPSSCTDLASKRKLWIWVGRTLWVHVLISEMLAKF